MKLKKNTYVMVKISILLHVINVHVSAQVLEDYNYLSRVLCYE